MGGCTGTLINSRTILTAAHCFYDNDRFAPGSVIVARFGADAKLPARYDRSGSVLAVAPGYTFTGSDIAVVTLNAAFSLSYNGQRTASEAEHVVTARLKFELR